MLHTSPPPTAGVTSTSARRIGGSKSPGNETFIATCGRPAEPDAELIALGQRWRVNEARLQAASNDHAASDEAQRLRRAIVRLPARTQAGIDLKIEIAASCIEGPFPDDEFVSILDQDDTATEAAVMWSLVRDLEAQQRSSPDAELLRLGRLFEAAWAVEKAAWNVSEANESDEAAADRWEAACAATRAIVEKIVKLPATTMAGLVVKARACSWSHSDEPIEDGFFSNQRTLDERLVVSVLRDLLAVDGRVSSASAATQVAA